MHASIRRYKLDSMSVGEVFQKANDGFVPAISKVPGFVGYYGLDAGNGELVTISLFKDQAGTKESERAAAEWVGKNASHLLQTPPEITTGEVGMHKTNLSTTEGTNLKREEKPNLSTPEPIKEHWTTLKPKVRELWPNLTDLDMHAINGDGELLVTKVREKNAIAREDIFNKLAPYMPKLAPMPGQAPR